MIWISFLLFPQHNLAGRLADDNFAVRQFASKELSSPQYLPTLSLGLSNRDLEVKRRCENAWKVKEDYCRKVIRRYYILTLLYQDGDDNHLTDTQFWVCYPADLCFHLQAIEICKEEGLLNRDCTYTAEQIVKGEINNTSWQRWAIEDIETARSNWLNGIKYKESN